MIVVPVLQTGVVSRRFLKANSPRTVPRRLMKTFGSSSGTYLDLDRKSLGFPINVYSKQRSHRRPAKNNAEEDGNDPHINASLCDSSSSSSVVALYYPD